MKEMSLEDKQRIEKEAQKYLNNLDEALSDDEIYFVRIAHIAGAIHEHERMAELLKEERNKAIQECITAMLNDQDILFNGSDILEKLESFKR